jgi:predicted nucleic acid-binding protein
MKYFLDTNIISRIVSNDVDTMKIVKNIAEDEESEFFVNELVYMESLRAIPLTHKKLFERTKEALENFESLDIPQEIYSKSIAFARYCKSKGLSFGKCEAIDYLHFMTAKHYGLEIISHDGDMLKLQEKYEEFIGR